MRKKLLMVIALLVSGVGNLWAQTDVTSTYLTNADFSGSKSEVTLSSPNTAVSSDRKIYEPEGWSLAILNKSKNNMTVVNTGDPQQSSMFTGTYAPTDGKYMVRFRDDQKTEYIDLSQTITINVSGVYTISADLIRENDSKVNVVVYAGDANASNSSAGTWENCGFDATYNKGQKVQVGVKFTNLGAGGHKAGADNIKIVYKSNNGSTLAALIAQATAINAKLGNLTSEIEVAQGVYDGINNTLAYQETIDNAISTLQSAINTKVAAYSLNPAGDDISALYIWNNGFDIDINFSSSSSTNTTAATVYPTFGWAPTVPTNCTGATIGYGYSGNINGSGNVTAPTQNADGTTDGGALIICVGWSGLVTYKSLAKTFPAGSYRITYRAYNGNTKNTTAEEVIPLVGFIPTSGESQINSATETFANQAWSTHTYDFELHSETEGQIQIGLQPTENTNSYNAPELFIDEVKLTYFDPLKLAQIQWQEVWYNLNALDKTLLPDAAEEAITAELEKAVPTTTVDAVNEAKAALQALIDSYDDIKVAYNKLSALITLATNEKNNSTGTKTDIESAISTATTNIETRTAAADLTSDYNTLEEAREAYITGGAEPDAGHPFDFTFKLTNPSFESTTTGWTVDRNTTGTWNYDIRQNSPVDGNDNLNVWAQQINYINVYQNVTLAEGSYSLKGYLYSDQLKAQHIYANNGTDHPSDNLASSASWEQLTANFSQTEESSVKLGIYSQGNNVSGDSKGWFRADYFQLFYNGIKPLRREQLLAAITTANTLYNSGANVGPGVFQIPVAAGTAFHDAISDAQGVYEDDDATTDDITGAISDLETAIETFNAAGQNAPSESQAYIIANTTANGALKIAESSITVGANAAVYFTAVDGGYVLSNASGLYILKTDADNYTLSTTETKGDAYVVTVTPVDGGFTIRGTNGLFGTDNTAAGSKVYADKSKNNNGVWTITEATAVNMRVTAGKWGTFIAPFDVTIPANISAYTATGVNNNKVTLEAVETTIPANTPVLLRNETGDLISETFYGVSTATADSYTVGLLTGVYTAATIAASDGSNTRYVLQTQEDVQAFYKVTSAFTPSPNRCYLTVPVASGVKAFYLDGDETAVSSVKADELQGATIYNLAGQRVSKAQKGVYIINGKKVAVK